MHLDSILRSALGRPRRVAPGLREAPMLSGGLPVLGHTVEFLRGTMDLLFRAQRELGEVAAFRVGHRRMIALYGPRAHEAVFRAPDSQLSPREAYKIMTPVFGRGIAYDAAPGVMDEQLKMLLAALQDKRMRTYGEIVLAEVERSISTWGEEGELDLVDYCRSLTSFTSTHCLIGQEFRERMTEEFAAVYHDLERGVTPVAYLSANLPLPAFRRRDQARVRLVEMISRIVLERKRSGRGGEDMLQTLMDASYSTGRALSDDEITGLLLAAIFAGHHTSSVTAAWTIIELLQDRPYLDRVLHELNDVYGARGAVTYQSLREIHLTEYAVKEALRLHPPLFMLVRVANEDFVYDGYDVPAGTWLVVSPTVSHRLGHVFRDPDRFDPDRFAPPREEDKQDFAFIPFGGGRHRCLGNAFALLQVKAILAVLLRRYELELGGGPIRGDFHGLVVGPSQPCKVRYRRRSKPNARAGTARSKIAAAPAGVCPVAHYAPAPARTRLRILLDRDLCQGHAVCVGEAPAVFSLGEDGKVTLRPGGGPPGAHDEAVRRAAAHCPTGTIRLEEDVPAERTTA